VRQGRHARPARGVRRRKDGAKQLKGNGTKKNRERSFADVVQAADRKYKEKKKDKETAQNSINKNRERANDDLKPAHQGEKVGRLREIGSNEDVRHTKGLKLGLTRGRKRRMKFLPRFGRLGKLAGRAHLAVHEKRTL